jgi:hypothetical protein
MKLFGINMDSFSPEFYHNALLVVTIVIAIVALVFSVTAKRGRPNAIKAHEARVKKGGPTTTVTTTGSTNAVASSATGRRNAASGESTLVSYPPPSGESYVFAGRITLHEHADDNYSLTFSSVTDTTGHNVPSNITLAYRKTSDSNRHFYLCPTNADVNKLFGSPDEWPRHSIVATPTGEEASDQIVGATLVKYSGSRFGTVDVFDNCFKLSVKNYTDAVPNPISIDFAIHFH